MKITLLNKQQIEKKLNRIAFQIVEQHIDSKAIALVGIAEAGLVIAHKLADLLKTITTIEVQVIALRMDKKQPLNKEIEKLALEEQELYKQIKSTHPNLTDDQIVESVRQRLINEGLS